MYFKRHSIIKSLYLFGQVQPDSPAEKAGLQPFFDFILSLDNKRLVGLILVLSLFTDYSLVIK